MFLQNALSQISLWRNCCSAYTLQMIFNQRSDDVHYQEDIILCPSLAEVILLSVFTASRLRIIAMAGGGRE